MHQTDLFESGKPIKKLELTCAPDTGYRFRTIRNASLADLTLAVAMDFTTSGERLTHRAAGKKFVSIAFDAKLEQSIEALSQALHEHQVKVLNIAGNGLYTYLKFGVNQAQCNLYMTRLLKGALLKYPASIQIRSGGQTGADWAGLVAGYALGIPVLGYFPKGFKQRGANGVDFDNAVETLERSLRLQAEEVLRCL